MNNLYDYVGRLTHDETLELLKIVLINLETEEIVQALQSSLDDTDLEEVAIRIQSEEEDPR